MNQRPMLKGMSNRIAINRLWYKLLLQKVFYLQNCLIKPKHKTSFFFQLLLPIETRISVIHFVTIDCFITRRRTPDVSVATTGTKVLPCVLLEFVVLLQSRTTPDVSVDRTGTIHKFDPVAGTDYMNKNRIQTQISTKLFNLCAMSVYQRMSMEVQKKKILYF